MNTRKHIAIALLMALTFLGLPGCGTTNHLQTITLSAAGSSGLFNVKGEGGTLQLVAKGNYSSTQTRDLTNVVTYTVTPTGNSLTGPLPAPPLTMSFSKTGLLTATPPFACSWTDLEPDKTQNKPAWFLDGSYQVVATTQGISSQPIFVAVASSSGDGPNSACGP